MMDITSWFVPFTNPKCENSNNDGHYDLFFCTNPKCENKDVHIDLFVLQTLNVKTKMDIMICSFYEL